MVFQYASDLHLEFPRNKAFLGTKPLAPKADILLLAGDIVPFAFMDRQQDFFDYISDHFEQTYWLPGNHEYYHGDINMRSGKVYESIRENVQLVNNRAIEIKGTKLIFSTLWTHINKSKTIIIENSLTDFRAVKHQGNPFTADDFNNLHKDCLTFIKDELTSPFEGKTIVVSHHVPTLQHYPEKYLNSPINEGFAVDLSSWITDHGPDYWIYGHNHHNPPQFQIGKTQMMTNQLGYVERNEHGLFRKDKVVDN